LRWRFWQSPSADQDVAVPAECESWRQGDVFDYRYGLVAGTAGKPKSLDHVGGVAVLTQTCDVIRTDRPYLQVAPLVTLERGESDQAALRRRPRYVRVPQMDGVVFVDLDHITTVPKRVLASHDRSPSLSDDDSVRNFATDVGRKFSRFAFPDEVDASLKSLQEELRSKAHRVQSPFGQILGRVSEVRVFSDSWLGPTYEVVLVFVLQPGSLPDLDDLGLRPPPTLSAYFSATGAVEADLTRISEALLRDNWSPEEAHWLWQAVGMAAAEKVRKAAGNLGLTSVVSVTHDVVSADEFSLAQVRKSETLDLYHLSPPRPL
jgi:hypothetical protein